MNRFIFGAMMLVALMSGQANAAVVTVTESQVRDVCGSALQSDGGAIGCRKGATDEGKCQAITRAAGSSGARSGGTSCSQ